jgi:hypothetical protein
MRFHPENGANNQAAILVNVWHAVLMVLIMTGCTTVNKHSQVHRDEKERPAATSIKNSSSFAKHHNPGVRVPARAGGTAAGLVVGVPATIVLIPITAPVGAALDSNIFPMVPMVVCWKAGDTLFGAMAWPFFGWWHWPNETVESTGDPRCKKCRAGSTEPGENDPVSGRMPSGPAALPRRHE